MRDEVAKVFGVSEAVSEAVSGWVSLRTTVSQSMHVDTRAFQVCVFLEISFSDYADPSHATILPLSSALGLPFCAFVCTLTAVATPAR